MSLDTDDVMSGNEWNSAFELAMGESQGSSWDDEELARLEESARSSSTTAATKSGIRKFEDWLQRRWKSCDYASISAVELNDLLRKYYAEVKNYKTGQALKPSSMTGLRAAIHRYITAAPFLRPINILTDREFETANNMFNARCKLFYKCGYAKPKLKRHGNLALKSWSRPCGFYCATIFSIYWILTTSAKIQTKRNMCGSQGSKESLKQFHIFTDRYLHMPFWEKYISKKSW